MNSEKMDNSLTEQIQELCVLCAKGIAKISKETGVHPKFVAKLFLDVFTKVTENMEKL